ncbi:uncharacterized protein LOC128235834 [Mya arenaria]|uniref:uncharacterized protein LOC128235834 n=1 Tax=Mya arenaria TaxID=6604 RepID=UPI0022E3F44A|nr:uncharacterized protein LOC128235834 [Mya arenaria]
MNLLNAVCLTVSICVIFAKTEISLDVGTCGNNTTLTCSGSGTFSWDIQKGYELLVGKGDVLEETKYSVIVSSTSVKLTIHNTDISDIGIYACEVAYDGRSNAVQLQFDCPASNITATVNNLGRVELSTDRLYPMHKDFQVSVFQGISEIKLRGATQCKISSSYPGYFTCWWTSDDEVLPGEYTYVAIVTTLTPSRTFTGSFVKDSTDGRHWNVTLYLTSEDDNVYGTTLEMVCKVVALQDNTYTMWKRNFQTVALIYSWDIPVILPELYEYNYTSNNEMHFYIKNLSSGNHKDIWTCGTALKNGQIITSNQIQIDITGKPNVPSDVSVFQSNNSLVITFVKGDSGGYMQTFVLEGKLHGNDTWGILKTVEDDLVSPVLQILVDNVQSNTLYDGRVYSYNVIGKSEFTNVFTFALLLPTGTSMPDSSVSQNGVLAGTVVGSFTFGTIAGMLVSCVFISSRTRTPFGKLIGRHGHKQTGLNE